MKSNCHWCVKPLQYTLWKSTIVDEVWRMTFDEINNQRCGNLWKI